MTVKRADYQQYKPVVDAAAAQRLPRLRTVRRALGMSGAQLGRKMGVTRARISQIELTELSGAVPLKAMQAMAEAMGCRFVYAIVPPNSFEELIAAQARKKAERLVDAAAEHRAQDVERLTREIAHKMPADLWDDDE